MFQINTEKTASTNNNVKSKKYVLARQLAILCALDFEPFSITSRNGFRLFCKANSIDIDILPSERTIAENALPDVYNVCIQEIKTILKLAPKNVALVMDCWTDNYRGRSFVNYKVHYCENFKIYVLTLKTNILERPHT